MTKAVINIGTNTTSGDSQRIAIQKAAANFDDLYTLVGAATTALNQLSLTLSNTTSTLAPLSGAIFTGAVTTTGGLTAKASNLTVQPASNATGGKLIFSTASGAARWSVSLDSTGSLSFTPASATTAAMAISPAGYLSLSGSPVYTQAHADQDGRANVSWAGGDPTGQIDSSAAFQASLDALAAVGGGTLMIPPGLYLIGQPLTWTSSAGLSIQGVNGASVILQRAQIVFDLSSGPFTVRDLAVRCDRQGGSFVRAQGAAYASASGLQVTTTSSTNYLDSVFDLTDVTSSQFSASVLSNTTAAPGTITDISSVNGSAFKLRGTCTTISFSTIEARGFYTGFDMQSAVNPGIERISFRDCRVTDVARGVYCANTYSAIQPVCWSGGTISAFQYGIYVSGGAAIAITATRIVRNCVLNLTGEHIYLNQIASGGTISGNILDVANNVASKGVGAVTGVHLFFCDALAVTDNNGTLSADCTGMVLVENSTACTIANNRARGFSNAFDAVRIVSGSNNVSTNNRTA